MQFFAPKNRNARFFSHFRPVLFLGLILGIGIVATSCDLPGFGSDDSPPDSPTGLSADSEDSAIALDWETVQAGDLGGYNVYRSTSAIGDVSGKDPVNGGDPVSDASYTDNATDNGTTYHYVVTAVDKGDNESDPSGEVQKTPFADPPDRP